jgi:hypothetical protein
MIAGGAPSLITSSARQVTDGRFITELHRERPRGEKEIKAPESARDELLLRRVLPASSRSFRGEEGKY